MLLKNWIFSPLKLFFSPNKREKDYSSSPICDSVNNRSKLFIFKQVLEDPYVRSFLEFDECFLLADNYLISMVFVYFVRSNLKVSHYDAPHFFSALCLAHEMEEDLDGLKEFIVPWLPWPIPKEKLLVINKIKKLFWIHMDYNCLVSLKECEWVMKMTSNWNVWKRIRNTCHLMDAVYTKVFKSCCGPILSKAARFDSNAICVQDDYELYTSDWSTCTNLCKISDSKKYSD